MEAAEALHRHDAAIEQQLDRFRENGIGGFAGIAPLQLFLALRKFTQLMCGPQSQQASGCAWKRRSSGSAYSAAQRGTWGNPSWTLPDDHRAATR